MEQSSLKCSVCGCEIEGSYYQLPGSKQIVCTACYEKDATVCPVCKELLPASEPARTFEGKRYHMMCFHCQKCDHLFGNVPPTVVDGLLCCMRCTQKCAGCGQVLGNGRIVTLDGKQYHDTCLVCFMCKTPLPPGDISLLDDKPICAACIEKL